MREGDGIEGKHAEGTRISDVEEENNKVVGREEARQTGRGLFLFPFPRASVGSFSTPALGRGRRRREERTKDHRSHCLPPRLVLSCLFRSLLLLLYPTPHQLYIPPLLSRASRLSSESLSPLLFAPPRARTVSARPPPPHTILALPVVPQTHTDTGVGRPLSFNCLWTASPPVQGCHIRCSILGPARSLRARAIRTQLAYVSGRQ